VRFVGRYVANHTSIPDKLITPVEAVELAIAGIPVFPIFENGANQTGAATGQSDGAFAAAHLPTVGLLPNTGVVIYYAEDFDVGTSDIAGIVEAFAAFGSELPGYGIGVYSCGFCTGELLAQGLVARRWLSCSSSFNGTRQAFHNGDYDMAQAVPKDIEINNHTINVDLDTLRDTGVDIGARVPWGGAIPQNGPLSVVAVQMLLNRAGQTPPLATDGGLGPLTKAAIVASKQRHGLPADTSIDWVNWVPLLCQDAGVQILPPGPAALTS
jgi:peptidoglycan hydrolase-like protein with peptidoglycan-binding domain